MTVKEHLCLEHLERDKWSERSCASHLVTTCHALRKKPVRDFSIEDLRIMIGQSIGLKYLVPKALEHLQENPLAAGDFFEGDLLFALLKSDAYAVLNNKYLDEKIIPICEAVLALKRNDLDPRLVERCEATLTAVS